MKQILIYNFQKLFYVAFKSDILYSYYKKKQISPETDTKFPKWIVGEWSKVISKFNFFIE